MKLIFFILLLVAILIFISFIFLSKTEQVPDTSLEGGKLRACPDTPNCVSSEISGEKFIAPFKSKSSLDDLWAALQAEVVEQGGTVVKSEPDYFWATFESKLFKFTDDFELRRDNRAKAIQVRAGARAGNSDFDVNRKRIEAIRAAVQ